MFNALIPIIMEKYSSAPPIRVPSKFMPRALPGSFTWLKVIAKMTAANKRGATKISAPTVIRATDGSALRAEIGNTKLNANAANSRP